MIACSIWLFKAFCGDDDARDWDLKILISKIAKIAPKRNQKTSLDKAFWKMVSTSREKKFIVGIWC